MSRTTHPSFKQRGPAAAAATAREEPRWPTTGTLLIAWIGTLAVSHAPQVVAAEALGLAEAAVPWLWLGSAAVLVAVSARWSRARSLLPYFTVLLAVVLLAGIVLPLLGGWLPLDGRSDLTQALGNKAAFFVVALGVAAVLARTERPRETAFVTAGDLQAPTAVRLPGMRQPLSWAVVGPAAAVLLFGAFAGVTVADGVFGPGAGRQLLVLAPLIIACAAFNAFGEEVMYRAGPLSMLLPAVGPSQAVLMTAAWFGLGHYYGSVPSGVEGVVMSGLLGLILGRAMVATRGLVWPLVIHTAIDFVVFASIAAGAS